MRIKVVRTPGELRDSIGHRVIVRKDWEGTVESELSPDEIAAAGFHPKQQEPQMTWKLKPLNPLGSIATILGVALLAALYPAIKASRGRPVDALRSL